MTKIGKKTSLDKDKLIWKIGLRKHSTLKTLMLISILYILGSFTGLTKEIGIFLIGMGVGGFWYQYVFTEVKR